MQEKIVLGIDLDGVVADFNKAMAKLAPDLFLGDGEGYEERSKMVDAVCLLNPDIFHNLEPMEGAIQAVNELFEKYDVYFVSTPMYAVVESYTGKRVWLEKHFGDKAKKRLILTHRKDLFSGQILIDDRIKNGVENFKGQHIHFGSELYPDWKVVLNVLL